MVAIGETLPVFPVFPGRLECSAAVFVIILERYPKNWAINLHFKGFLMISLLYNSTETP
jgi:hypothetical protein